ncbi:MAG: hypothetical protein Q9224_000353 [Gallowayella concinna]
MVLGISARWYMDHPRISLTLLFISWKALLLLIAWTSPHPGYDTSTTLLTHLISQRSGDEYVSPSFRQVLANQLTRWDAIYFTNIAHRGALFEQEWAFGWGYTKIISTFGPCKWFYQARLFAWVKADVCGVVLFDSHADLVEMAIAGIFVSNTAHLLSVLVLFEMSKLVAARPLSHSSIGLAWISASLHILSPAGLFLSAPYAESSFSFLNFVGFGLYALNLQAHNDSRPGLRDTLALVSGLVFGLATTFRSNGLLSGLLFCFDIVNSILPLRSDAQAQRIIADLRRVSFLIIAGSLMAVVSFFPQFLAYQEYCVEGEPEHWAAWCTHRIPSIYTWVQSHYWNVGLFRYWTLSNAPLFMLATPMLLILILSADCLFPPNSSSSRLTGQRAKSSHTPIGEGWMSPIGKEVGQRLAVLQLLLAVLAFTSYHVQIVTRISSGYPLWYWWLASKIMNKKHISLAGYNIPTKGVVGWMVTYALLQAGLFAAFLPPA